MKEMKVRATFTEEILGTSPSNERIFSDFIASNAPDALKRDEEIATIGAQAVEEKAMTVFPKDENGNPFLYDYQIKGFFKNAAKAYNAFLPAKEKLTAFKTKIDNLIFIKERKIPLVMPEDTTLGCCQRPLRADTAQGPRTALASSDSCPVGTTIEFTVIALNDDLMRNVIDWLDYGKLNGIGQWHNSGKGRFYWKDITHEGE